MKEKDSEEKQAIPTVSTNLTFARRRRRLVIEERSSLTLSNPGTNRANVPYDYPAFSLATNKLKTFIELLDHPTIKSFHIHDSCCLSSDKYLLAIVLVYFTRAEYQLEDYTVRNFFLALYLAHDVEEEIDDYKWEILPWALGKDWSQNLKNFTRARYQLFCKMRCYGNVSHACCRGIFNAIEQRYPERKLTSPILIRKRDAQHGHVIRQTIRINTGPVDGNNNPITSPAPYNPKGPIWHQETEDGYPNDINPEPCAVCKTSMLTKLMDWNASSGKRIIIDDYQELFMKAKIEIENDIPIILSQGLDIGDDGSMFETSMENDSEEEDWESPSSVRVRSAGCTGRHKRARNEGRIVPSISDDEMENEVFIAPEAHKKKCNKRRKRENRSFLALSPADDMDETINMHHQNTNLLPNAEVVSENEDDDDMFTQESDNEDVQGQVLPTNKEESLRKKAKRGDKVQFDYEHAHRMRLRMGTSEVDVLDILNQSVC